MKKIILTFMLVFAASSVFAQKSEFRYKVNKKENYVTITGWNGAGTKCVIPDEIEGRPVEVFSSMAFNKKMIHHLVLPKNLRLIQYRAFGDAENEYHIKTIEVPIFLQKSIRFGTQMGNIGFIASLTLHGWKPGTYTSSYSGIWLRNNELPSSYATVSSISRVHRNPGQHHSEYLGIFSLDIKSINGFEPLNFSGRGKYVMLPGAYKFEFVGNNNSSSVFYEINVEAGKEYKILYYVDAVVGGGMVNVSFSVEVKN